MSWLDALSVAGFAAVLSLATSAGNADFIAGTPAPAHLTVDHIDEMTTTTKYRPAHAAVPVNSPPEDLGP